MQQRLSSQRLPFLDCVQGDASTWKSLAIARSTGWRAGIVEQLRLAGLAYLPISHLNWGLWGLSLTKTSEVRDFDFEAHGRQRLQMYRTTRAQLLDGSMLEGLGGS